jgi:hypothetical protein
MVSEPPISNVGDVRKIVGCELLAEHHRCTAQAAHDDLRLVRLAPSGFATSVISVPRARVRTNSARCAEPQSS